MEPQQRTRRLSPRAGVSWTAWIRAGTQRFRCHTIDVSTTGAKLRPRGEIHPGTTVQLLLHSANGRRFHTSAIVWRLDSDGMAILFLRSLPVHATVSTQRPEPRRRGWSR